MTKQLKKDDSAEISLGRANEQGGRPNIEDRVEARSLVTAGELQLTVGMVADGVGGSNYGERAAELAIEVVFREIEASTINDPKQIPDLLRSALEKANEAVYQEGRAEKEKRGMGSTATLAVIHNSKLFLANVGDSRAYLVRGRKGEKIKQLTQDHTWAAEMVALGRLTPADAASHPKAEELVRSIGYGSEVNVDLGLYKNGSETEEAAQQYQGFSLQADDRIVLCSDGLIKARHNGNQPYVTDAEIAQTVTRRTPDKAASALVQTAISRRADDNVSAIVLEMPGSKRAFYLPPAALYGGISALVLLVMVAGALFFNSRRPDPLPTPAAEIVLPDQTDTSSTPLPSTTQSVDTVPEIINGPTQLTFEDGTQLHLNSETIMHILARPEESEGGAFELELEKGSVVVVAQRVPVIVSNSYGAKAEVSNGTIGVAYDPEAFQFNVACLRGEECRVKGDLEGMQILTEGYSSIVGGKGIPAAPVAADYAVYYAFASAVVPAPTATPTPTLTPTPTETPTNKPTRWPTSTPTPEPTEIPTTEPPTATTGSGGDGTGDDNENNPPPPPAATSEPPTTEPPVDD